MKIGKLNLESWTYGDNKLHNPIRILWNLFMWLPYTISLAIFCIFKGLLSLDCSEARDMWESNSPF